MNEKLEVFLESPTTVWDSNRRFKQPVNITLFVDETAGVWNTRDLVAPCGGVAECRSNGFRTYFFCPKHESEGVLVIQYRNNLICWISGKEVKQ